MKASKKSAKKGSKATTTTSTPATTTPVTDKKADLVGGLFHKGSFKARIFTLLSDGMPHSKEELEKVAKGCSNVLGRIAIMKKNQHLDIVKKDDGYILRTDDVEIEEPKTETPIETKPEVTPEIAPEVKPEVTAKKKAAKKRNRRSSKDAAA